MDTNAEPGAIPPFAAGAEVETAGRTVAESDINAFAGLVGDFTPIHMDAEFARGSPFGERIAHGPLTMSTAIGLLTQTGWLGAKVIALLSLSWDFSAPVKIGDTIRARVRVEALTPTKRPGRAKVVFRFDVRNQRDEAVQTGVMTVLRRTD